MDKMYIEYKGTKYPYRECYHRQAGMDVLIGGGSLDRALMTEDGDYVDEQARFIDEKFYGFVEDKVLDLPYDEFETYVNEVLD